MRLLCMLCMAAVFGNAQFFTKITDGPQSNDGGDSRSVNWVDYDNDGDLDLFFTNGPASQANNFLYRNNGNGTFAKVTDLSIVNDPGSYDGSTWADYDNDGFIDAFSATWYGQTNRLHRHRDGVFEKVFAPELANDQTFSETASWGDYDNDGYVDLYLANSAGTLVNHLYHNNGDGTFTKIQSGPHVSSASPTRSVDWCDFDNDGDLDLFTANESNVNSSLYWNNGDGTFTAETAGQIVLDGGNSFGSSVADIDNDGDVDILVVNHAGQNEFLYLNNGDRTFTKIVHDTVVLSGGFSVGSAFGDLDNDGDLDLIVTNAFAGNSSVKNFLYVNNGDGTFMKVDTGVVSNDPGWSYGVALGDYDRDGDLDIAVANCFGANQNNALYRNEGNTNKWITVKAVGTVSNVSAIGARVKVKAVINGTPSWQVRHVSGQSGYCGQNLESHFGLGDASVIDSLIVEFPSGQKNVRTNVSPNQLLVVTEKIPSGFFRGALQISTFREMAPTTIFFKDISIFDPAHPPVSWDWHLNGDGIVDATTPTASFNYTAADTFSVSLVIHNGTVTDTVISHRSIVISPSASIIHFSTATHNFGIIDVNVPIKDTTMYVFNRGKQTDSLSVSLLYGSSTPGTIKPDSALSISPASFMLAPGDSQAVTFRIYPSRVIRTNLNITYTPKIILTSANNLGGKVFEKTLWIKLQGMLMEVGQVEHLPSVFALRQNYPNPFNPTTTISFDVASQEQVHLRLYDSIGREVKTLVNETLPQGSYQVRFDAGQLSSGLYLYTMKAGNFRTSKKLMVMK